MDPEQYKLIQDAVSKGVTSAQWWLILLSLAAAGLGAYIGAYLRRKAVSRAIKEDFPQFLEQLQRQTEVTEQIKGQISKQTTIFIEELRGEQAKESERLRSALQVETHKKETRFSEWHQRQATILAELYRLLVQVEETLRPLLPDFQGGPIAKTIDAREKLRKYFEENTVVIPDHIEERVDSLLSLLSHAILRGLREDIDSSERQKIVSVLGTEMPQLREDIRLQIRTVLSGKSDSPLDVTKPE